MIAIKSLFDEKWFYAGVKSIFLIVLANFLPKKNEKATIIGQILAVKSRMELNHTEFQLER